MSIRTFFYAFKEGVINLFKNRLMTFASIGTISACLLVVSIFYIVSSNVDYMVEAVQNNIGIAVFFDDGISEENILELKAIIEERPEVYKSTYISAEEAWQTFKGDYFSGREELLSGFENENPLENSASLQIFMADMTRQGELVTYINSLEGIRHIREDRQITDIIKTVSDMIQYISIVLIAVLLLISVFLISNTVRIGIEVRKKEINIMKFIGATDTFIRGPFW
ncbi:MAG: permease-like cell division protein FtsX [Vallitaleaceae bacterium]|nr:permease-like cell division protein FtsX [Vallitaleaceae bacterium]